MRHFLPLIFVLHCLVCSGQSDKQVNDFSRYFSLLTDSTDSIHTVYFGTNCGMGSLPEGRIAINYFINKMDYETVREILKGKNLEGRVYALEALLNAAKNKILKLTSDDKILMKTVLFSDASIHICWVCHTGKSKIEELFDSKLKRVLYQ